VPPYEHSYNKSPLRKMRKVSTEDSIPCQWRLCQVGARDPNFATWHDVQWNPCLGQPEIELDGARGARVAPARLEVVDHAEQSVKSDPEKDAAYFWGLWKKLMPASIAATQTRTPAHSFSKW